MEFQMANGGGWRKHFTGYRLNLIEKYYIDKLKKGKAFHWWGPRGLVAFHVFIYGYMVI
jgi:hypothetical protein